MTLTEFLLARITEDERAAQAIKATVDAGDGYFVSIVKDHAELAAGDCPGYITEYDPARVIAECEAKRHVIHRLDALLYSEPSVVHHADRSLRALAAVYADHPDYRDEWRP